MSEPPALVTMALDRAERAEMDVTPLAEEARRLGRRDDGLLQLNLGRGWLLGLGDAGAVDDLTMTVGIGLLVRATGAALAAAAAEREAAS